MIVNPGSKLKGGTEEQAIENAELWVSQMRNCGIRNVQVVNRPEYDGKFRWRFILKHSLTDVEATLDIHGLTDDEVKKYVNNNICKAYPRIYWNGCSSSEPRLEDFLTDGFCIDIVKETDKSLY
jgi:hypothetical protein